VTVALGTLLSVDDFTPRRIAALATQWAETIDHLLAVRVRQTAALSQEPFHAPRDLARRKRRERLLLVEGELGEMGLIVLECLDQGGGPIGTPEQGAEHAGAHRRRQRGHDLDERLADRRCLA